MSLFARSEQRSVTVGDVYRELGVSPRSARVGVPVTPDSAMRLSVWWGCVHLLASVVAGLPVDVFRKGPDGVRQEIDPVPSIVGAPSALVPAMAWRYQMMVSLLQRGNVVGLITSRDRRGYPLTVELLHPDSVRIVQKHQLAPASFYVNNEMLNPDDVWHVAAFNQPGSVVGMSPLAYARASLASGLAANQYAETFWTDGGHPTGVLSSDQALDADTATTVKERFKQATKDDKLAVLGAGLSYTAVQVSPSDAGWLDSINATDIMVCRFAGVPPEMMGVAASGSSVTYANREQRAIDFLAFSVQWWLTRIEESWSALLPRGVYARHNASAMLRTDTKTRAEVAQIRLGAGVTNADYERALEDLPPIPGGAGQSFVQVGGSSMGSPPPEEGNDEDGS